MKIIVLIHSNGRHHGEHINVSQLSVPTPDQTTDIHTNQNVKSDKQIKQKSICQIKPTLPVKISDPTNNGIQVNMSDQTNNTSQSIRSNKQCMSKHQIQQAIKHKSICQIRQTIQVKIQVSISDLINNSIDQLSKVVRLAYKLHIKWI